MELMESAPSLSLPQLSEVFEAVAARVEEAPDAAMRDMLLELIVTMCEECPKAARKIKGPAGKLCDMLLCHINQFDINHPHLQARRATCPSE